MQQVAQRCLLQPHASVFADGPNGKTVVGESLSGNAPKWEVPKRERARLSGRRASDGRAALLLR